jgi:hypothetical protein
MKRRTTPNVRVRNLSGTPLSVLAKGVIPCIIPTPFASTLRRATRIATLQEHLVAKKCSPVDKRLAVIGVTRFSHEMLRSQRTDAFSRPNFP